MKLIQTARIKLDIDPNIILPTFLAYTNAFNFICQEGFDRHIYNNISLHKLLYKQLRETLPSQLCISALSKSKEALKPALTAKPKKQKDGSFKKPKCPQSKLTSIRYDCNSYSLFLDKSELSLLTVNGRIKVPLKISEYHKKYFQSWTYKSAELKLHKKKNKIYLCIVFEKDISDPIETGKLLGIDRGINNIAVTSDNKFYGGSKVKRITQKYKKLRESLQKKNTKSAKRHLRKLSGKERRFKADTNHCIAKQIISSLNPGDKIIFENITGIRSKRTNKTVRTAINQWSYFQLELFLIYKAMEKGILFDWVDPRYTSQCCSKCKYRDKKNRKGNVFKCKECNFKLHADLNAARNICMKYLESKSLSDRAEVNQPNVSVEKLVTSSQF